MAIDYYLCYQSKPQATTCSSLIKMILALRTKLNSYKPFPCRIGDIVNFRAVVSSLREKTRCHSKNKHALPTRKQIKHI
ncbi:unnamed protein product [Rotaria sp. Silwood1]|nr:unnamed protein product [Rotaria sp. Silwood1]CAF1596398.1 unnamed protein product [Rotaria sp. Silwood1]